MENQDGVRTHNSPSLYAMQIHYIARLSLYPRTKTEKELDRTSRKKLRKHLKNIREHMNDNSEMIEELTKFHQL